VESEPGHGAVFSLYFPKIIEEASRDALTDETVLGGHERILFIDDEELIMEMGQMVLERLGYEVVSVININEALSLFKVDPARFDLVITDQTMPEMTGVELAKAILAIRPDMPVILCTGFSHLVDADAAKEAGIKAFAMKPMTKSEIAKTIRKVLDD
jgi:DNA-binding NtrC family response regulator